MLASDVLLAVPTRGCVSWQTVTRLGEIRDLNHGLEPILYHPSNLSVAKARNGIVRQFLAGRWSALAMVDDDVVPPPWFLDLRDDVEDGWGLVAVPHPMPWRHDPSRIALTIFQRFANGVGFAAPDFSPGPHECDAVATGAVMLSRAAVEALGWPAFRIDDDPDGVSEDFEACDRLREAGFRIGYRADSGWYSDHVTTVSLAPLLAPVRERSLA